MNQLFGRITLGIIAAALLFAARADAVVLEVGTAAARPGAAADIVLKIESPERPLGALVFSVGFDRARLRFDGTAKSGNSLSNVSVEAPQGYIASSTVLPHPSGDAIAISIVRSGMASPLREGQVVLRFETWPDAAGSAWVGVLPGGSAATTTGDLVPIEAIDGAVVVEAETAELHVSPSALDFDSPSTASVRVSNRGHGPLTITSLDVTGSGFSIDPVSLPLFLAPGTSADFLVRVDADRDTSGELLVRAGQAHARVALSFTPSDQTHEATAHRWIVPTIPGNEDLSIHLLDPENASSVSVYAGNALPATFELERQRVEIIRAEAASWYEVHSTAPTVRAALLGEHGRHLADATAFTDLPKRTGTIAAANLQDAVLVVANPHDDPIESEVSIRSRDGESLFTRVERLAPGQAKVIELPVFSPSQTHTITIHQSTPDASDAAVAAWIVERSVSGTTLRIAR